MKDVRFSFIPSRIFGHNFVKKNKINLKYRITLFGTRILVTRFCSAIERYENELCVMPVIPCSHCGEPSLLETGILLKSTAHQICALLISMLLRLLLAKKLKFTWASVHTGYINYKDFRILSKRICFHFE